jgi:cysteine synthase
MSILATIGHTRLVPLRHLVPQGGARILVKLEYENPTGSMKDRMALAMVEAAEADGRLKPAGSVVETARRLAAAPGCYWTDQLNNTDQLASYERMGEEIWEQAGGRISAFVQSVGTAGSLRGISTCLRSHDTSVRIVAVEPEESAVLSGRPSGSHKIEGTGAGFVVPLWHDKLADEIQPVSSQEAMETARVLARHEGIFAGTSTGANVAVALRVAKRLGPDHTVVTLAVDSGMKYLSTALYGG